MACTSSSEHISLWPSAGIGRGCLLAALVTVSCASGGSQAGSNAPGSTSAASARPAHGSAQGSATRPRMRERPTRLSDTARALISDNMQTHGEDMTMLLWSILFLDQDGAKQVSEVLATSPMIARPIGSQDSSLNALLPEAFFTLQDAFAQRTKGMLAIASKTPPDGPALARAFGDLAGTCVACHTTYLYEAPPAEPDSAARATRSR